MKNFFISHSPEDQNFANWLTELFDEAGFEYWIKPETRSGMAYYNEHDSNLENATDLVIVFSSQSLQSLVAGMGLPRIPLVPVSSSQAVVGAVCGLALARGMCGIRQIKWTVLRNIAIGWVATPAVAAVISYVALFVVQNVFEQVVYM